MIYILLSILSKANISLIWNQSCFACAYFLAKLKFIEEKYFHFIVYIIFIMNIFLYCKKFTIALINYLMRNAIFIYMQMTCN